MLYKNKVFKAFAPNYNLVLNNANTFKNCILFLGNIDYSNNKSIEFETIIRGEQNIILGCKDKYANTPIFLLLVLNLFRIINIKISMIIFKIKKLFKK